jgi:hypothetical protein
MSDFNATTQMVRLCHCSADLEERKSQHVVNEFELLCQVIVADIESHAKKPKTPQEEAAIRLKECKQASDWLDSWGYKDGNRQWEKAQDILKRCYADAIEKLQTA